MIIYHQNAAVLLFSIHFESYNFSHADRIMIKLPSIRKLLRSGGKIDDNLLELVATHEPWLTPILEKFYDSDLRSLSVVWKSLLRDLSSSSPAIGLVDLHVTYGGMPVLQSVSKHGLTNSNQLSALSNCAPFLYAVLREDVTYIKLLQPMICHMVQKIDLIMSFQPHELPADDCTTTGTSIETLPQLPKITARGDYAMDRKNKYKICTKRAPKHRSLTPGIFTITCIHGAWVYII